MFHIRSVIGPFSRGVLLPNAASLATSSPVLGNPALISVQPGSYASSTPGLVNFPVPNYNTITFTLRAGGGGGGTTMFRGDSDTNQYPSGGGATQLSLPGTPIIANGGLAGTGDGTGVPPAQGGSGGTVTTGGGGAGGTGVDSISGAPNAGSSGSAGGRVTKTFNRTDSGAPIPGAIIALTIGGGGQPYIAFDGVITASPGQNGSANVNWS